jgi:hypothetical protein
LAFLYLFIPGVSHLIPYFEIASIVETMIRVGILILLLPLLGKAAVIFARLLFSHRNGILANGQDSIAIGGSVYDSAFLIESVENRVVMRSRIREELIDTSAQDETTTSR